jgi:hypothetical protein
MDSELPGIIHDARSLTWGFLTQLDWVSLCLPLFGGIILDKRESDLDFFEVWWWDSFCLSILILEKLDRVRVRVRLCEPMR